MGEGSLPRQFGDYRLERVLGTGAIASTYLASTKRFGRAGQQVVVKQIHAYLAEQPEEVDLFLSEAQLLVAIAHPNIGAILDVGLLSGVPYLALEFLSGRDLAGLLVQRGKMGGKALPISICVEIGLAVAEALAHAHAACDAEGRPLQIVHRDISPNNVMVCFDGRVKLLDFGIAKSAFRATHTSVGMVRGTPGYMSPEQLRGGMVDERSDIFALGTLLYRLLAGVQAFPVVAGDFESYRLPLTEHPAPLHLVRKDLPSSLSLLVARALEKDVALRLQSAKEFAAGLSAVLEERGELGGKASAAPGAIGDLMAWLFPDQAYLEDEDEDAKEEAKPLAPSVRLPDASEMGAVLPDWEVGGDMLDETAVEKKRGP